MRCKNWLEPKTSNYHSGNHGGSSCTFCIAAKRAQMEIVFIFRSSDTAADYGLIECTYNIFYMLSVVMHAHSMRCKVSRHLGETHDLRFIIAKNYFQTPQTGCTQKTQNYPHATSDAGRKFFRRFGFFDGDCWGWRWQTKTRFPHIHSRPGNRQQRKHCDDISEMLSKCHWAVECCVGTPIPTSSNWTFSLSFWHLVKFQFDQR